ncbi:hypothetical protein NX029_26250 [Cytobacillus firmus]|nr:hypothetical protein [Cytobacillus firmus]
MGVVSYDVEASARRLETAFPMHTEEGVKSFLEKLYQLDELKYFAGDYDITIWIVDFYEAIRNAGLSPTEEKVIYFLYFEGYKQTELVGLLGVKKNTINTLLKRAVKKIAAYYNNILLADVEAYKASNIYGRQLVRGV